MTKHDLIIVAVLAVVFFAIATVSFLISKLRKEESLIVDLILGVSLIFGSLCIGIILYEYIQHILFSD